MSGWWLASLAASATRLASAIAALKPSSSTSRTMLSPARRHALPPARPSSVSRQRGAEAVELDVAHDAVARAAPRAAVRQPLVDLAVAQSCHTLSFVSIGV